MNYLDLINDIKETLEYYIASFYGKRNIVPKEVIVPKIILLYILGLLEL